MTKKEIKTATDSQLIYDLTLTFSTYIYNFNMNKGYKMALSHCRDLVNELHKRDVLNDTEYNSFFNYYLGDF